MRKVTPEPALPVNAETQRAVYLAWCRDHHVHPSERILG
jgi:hypothetical protein